MTKGTEYSLFVSEATRAALADDSGLRMVGEREVRGRKHPITLWTLG
jgi:class 3 adenylate cyclase